MVEESTLQVYQENVAKRSESKLSDTRHDFVSRIFTHRWCRKTHPSSVASVAFWAAYYAGAWSCVKTTSEVHIFSTEWKELWNCRQLSTLLTRDGSTLSKENFSACSHGSLWGQDHRAICWDENGPWQSQINLVSQKSAFQIFQIFHSNLQVAFGVHILPLTLGVLLKLKPRQKSENPKNWVMNSLQWTAASLEEASMVAATWPDRRLPEINSLGKSMKIKPSNRQTASLHPLHPFFLHFLLLSGLWARVSPLWSHPVRVDTVSVCQLHGFFVTGISGIKFDRKL